MAYDPKAQKKYNESSIQYKVSYNKNDLYYGERIKAYIDDKNMSANAFIKMLIKNFFDELDRR